MLEKIIKKKYNIMFIFCIIIIAVASLWTIGIQERIRVVDDEFAYWGIAATFAGYDWSDILASTGFYSYGYSFLLVPLYLLHRLGVSIVLIYRMAIAMNGVFLILSFGCYIHLGKKLFPELNKYYLLFAGLVTTLYVGNIANAGIAWTENYLYFMFWCCTLCMYYVMKSPNWKNCLLLILTTVNLFAIHMRSLGVVIAVGMVLLFSFYKNRKKIPWKKMLLFAIAFFLTFAAAMLFKEFVTGNIYADNAQLATNDFSGQTGKVKSVASVYGLLDLALSVMGKLYYIASATYLFGFLGIIVFFKQVISYLTNGFLKKKWEITEKEYTVLFIGLAFLGGVMVAAIYKVFPYYSGGRYPYNSDNIIYGRYIEHLIGPILLLGFSLLPNIKEYIREICFCLIVYFLTALATQHQFDLLAASDTNWLGIRSSAVPGIAHFFTGDFTNYTYHVMVYSIVLFSIMVGISLLGRKEKIRIASTCIALLIPGMIWVRLGTNIAVEFTEEKVHKTKTVESVVSLINYVDTNIPVYYINEDRSTSFDLKIMQWLCADRKISVITPEELQAKDWPEECVYLSGAEDNSLTAAVSEVKNYIYNSGSLCVYTEPGTKTEDVLKTYAADAYECANPAEKQVDLSQALTWLSYQKDNGSIYFNYKRNEGYLTEQMGVSLADGIYQFTVHMEISEYDGVKDIGYITVTNGEGTYMDTRSLEASDFSAGGKGFIRVSLPVKNYETPVIGVYTYGNCAMKINEITYRQVQGNAKASAGDFSGPAAILNQLADRLPYEICYIDSDSSALTGFPDYSGFHEYLTQPVTRYSAGEVCLQKETVSEQYLLVEKTGSSDLLFYLFTHYLLVAQTQDYLLMVPDTPAVVQELAACNIPVMSDGSGKVPLSCFTGVTAAEAVKEISLSKGCYSIRFNVPEVWYEESAEQRELQQNTIQQTGILIIDGKELELNGYEKLYASGKTPVKLGLLMDEEWKEYQDSLTIEKESDLFWQTIHLYDCELSDAVLLVNGVYADGGRPGSMTSPVYRLPYGEYSLQMKMQTQQKPVGIVGRIKVYQEQHLLEEIEITEHDFSGRDCDFAYDFTEYGESNEWYFVIELAEGNQVMVNDMAVLWY